MSEFRGKINNSSKREGEKRGMEDVGTLSMIRLMKIADTFYPLARTEFTSAVLNSVVSRSKQMRVPNAPIDM